MQHACRSKMTWGCTTVESGSNRQQDLHFTKQQTSRQEIIQINNVDPSSDWNNILKTKVGKHTVVTEDKKAIIRGTFSREKVYINKMVECERGGQRQQTKSLEPRSL
eukprot:TRINITY_DN2394_c0_g1_i6.p3 TRINITY_DN2394_c0_g1~~TRINITY_DN2394_c0_g1_i6.p3  ORF type:complete len:107 (+),score=5.51 TRINITY_DN2394_c0_g1_i6:919-1239(+)